MESGDKMKDKMKDQEIIDGLVEGKIKWYQKLREEIAYG